MFSLTPCCRVGGGAEGKGSRGTVQRDSGGLGGVGPMVGLQRQGWVPRARCRLDTGQGKAGVKEPPDLTGRVGGRRRPRGSLEAGHGGQDNHVTRPLGSLRLGAGCAAVTLTVQTARQPRMNLNHRGTCLCGPRPPSCPPLWCL